MSISKILNSTIHIVPETLEQDWDEDVTDLLVDLIDVLNGTFQTVTVSGASATIDFSLGRNVRLLLNHSTVLTLTNPRGGRPAYIYIKQGAGYGINWPGDIKWRGAASPTLSTGAGKIDVVALMYEPTDAIYLGEYALDYA
jgi:hypothetical protein